MKEMQVHPFFKAIEVLLITNFSSHFNVFIK